MLSPRIATLIASAWTAALLGGCATTSDGPAPVTPLSAENYRVTLPPPPAGVEPCLRKAFPEIPDRALTKRDVVRIIGEAKVQDRAKTACGLQAVTWINRVRADVAR